MKAFDQRHPVQELHDHNSSCLTDLTMKRLMALSLGMALAVDAHLNKSCGRDNREVGSSDRQRDGIHHKNTTKHRPDIGMISASTLITLGAPTTQTPYYRCRKQHVLPTCREQVSLTGVSSWCLRGCFGRKRELHESYQRTVRDKAQSFCKTIAKSIRHAVECVRGFCLARRVATAMS